VPDRPDDAIYVLGYSAAERQRLRDQAETVAPSTRALLTDAGITPGMRVLDVGCGPGDVALLAAELVGPAGEVVGVDTEPRSLAFARERAAAAGAGQVHFVQSDLREFVPDQPVDAVVGRFILMYLADPAGVVRHLTTHLRPGGIVAFQEFQIDHPPMALPAVPLWEQYVAWTRAVFRRASVELNMGLRLHQTFLAAGLPGPQLHMDVPLGRPGDARGARLAENGLRGLLPRLEQFGMATAAEVAVETYGERYAAVLTATGAVHTRIPMVRAWTRLPD
jgi:SAM-dependent methyltransferase